MVECHQNPNLPKCEIKPNQLTSSQRNAPQIIPKAHVGGHHPHLVDVSSGSSGSPKASGSSHYQLYGNSPPHVSPPKSPELPPLPESFTDGGGHYYYEPHIPLYQHQSPPKSPLLPSFSDSYGGDHYQYGLTSPLPYPHPSSPALLPITENYAADHYRHGLNSPLHYAYPSSPALLPIHESYAADHYQHGLNSPLRQAQPSSPQLPPLPEVYDPSRYYFDANSSPRYHTLPSSSSPLPYHESSYEAGPSNSDHYQHGK